MSGSMAATRTVVALWRYPLKSARGEAIESVDVMPGGLRGDRARIFHRSTLAGGRHVTCGTGRACHSAAGNVVLCM